MRDTGVIQAAMDQAVVDGIFPGGVLAGRTDGKIKILVVAGRLSSDPGDAPVRTSTIYDLASLTKPLATVTSVLLLVQAGKLKLDASIGDVLVELQGSPIGSASLRDLLAHRSGLPGWRPLYERLDAEGIAWGRSDPGVVRQAVLRSIRDEPLVSHIREQSIYSDLGFILLGCAVERASGLLLDDYFSMSVAQPLDAQPLFFNRDLAAACQSPKDRAAAALIAPTEWDDRRHRLLKGEVHDENAAAMGGVAGHAGLFGTAEAVLAVSGAWLAAYHGNRSLLDCDLVREFTSAHAAHSSWALGWDTPSAPSSSGSHFSPQSFGHLGFTGTSLWIDPVRKLEIVLLTNRIHPSRKNESIRTFRPLIHDLIYEELTGK